MRILQKEGARVPVGYQSSAALFAARLGRTKEAVDRIALVARGLPAQSSVWTDLWTEFARHGDAAAVRSLTDSFLSGASAVGSGRRSALAGIRAFMLLDLDDEALAFAERAAKQGVLIDRSSLAALRKFRDRRNRFGPADTSVHEVTDVDNGLESSDSDSDSDSDSESDSDDQSTRPPASSA